MREPLRWQRLPSGIPKTSTELVERYSNVVRSVVWRRRKYGISRADAVNEVWLRLLAANVVDNYVLNRLVFDPSLTEDAFRRYLYTAADNHLKNVFRTLARRHNRENARL